MIEVTPEMLQPRVTDNDHGEITVTHMGKEIRGWSYDSDSRRREKMQQAREYVEGFCDGSDYMKKTTLTVKGIHLRKRLRRRCSSSSMTVEIREHDRRDLLALRFGWLKFIFSDLASTAAGTSCIARRISHASRPTILGVKFDETQSQTLPLQCLLSARRLDSGFDDTPFATLHTLSTKGARTWQSELSSTLIL